MKAIRSFILIVVGAILFTTYCKVDKKDPAIKDITLKGSETELPLITSFANDFEQQYNVTLSVSGGGSNSGIRALLDGKIDIANSSRIISEEEKALLKAKKTKWVQAIIGSDAIAIITNPTFQYESLSLDQLSAIFSGKVTNWQQVGGPDKPITPYGRTINSGTRDFMKHRLNIENFRPQMKDFDTYAEIIANVKNDPTAIAYVSASCLKQVNSKIYEGVHVVKIFLDNEPDHTPFDEEAIKSGSYALIRPLFQYYDSSNVNPNIKKFIQYEISEKGDYTLIKNGYYPLNVFHKQINAYNGFN